MHSTLLRAISVTSAVSVCLLLLGCSEPPEDSDRVVYCKTVVEYVAYNPTDLTYVRVEEVDNSAGVWVEIDFDDFNKYGAKHRRRVNCTFGEGRSMTEIIVDDEFMIPELVRNLNATALLKQLQEFSEELKRNQ